MQVETQKEPRAVGRPASETSPKDELQALPEGKTVYEAFLRSPESSNKHSSYFQTYGQLLEQYRGRPIIFVEIGIFSGGSLFMWRDYFGERARIIGVEYNPDAIKWRQHGFEIYIGSQSDPNFWEEFFKSVGPVDVVLDDGGHTYEQQIATVHYALPHVQDGGLIIVEDTHTSYLRDFGHPTKYSFIEWVKSLLDQINARFHALKPSQLPYSNAIRSVEVFESIVAFKINRALCGRSHPVSNGRESDRPKDYRFVDFERTLWFLPEALRKSRFGQKLQNSLAKRASRTNLRKLARFFR